VTINRKFKTEAEAFAFITELQLHIVGYGGSVTTEPVYEAETGEWVVIGHTYDETGD
jgi:hypothetical protein